MNIFQIIKNEIKANENDRLKKKKKILKLINITVDLNNGNENRYWRKNNGKK